jgi:hypothetical protein
MRIPTDSSTAAPALPASPRRVAVDWLLRAALTWLGIYLVEQGMNGFFARTVDVIDTLWVKLVFLNIPLQVLLAVVTLAASRSTRPGALKVGLYAGVANAVLILVHIVLSVATA